MINSPHQFALLAAVVVAGLLCVSVAVPLDDTDDTDEDVKRSMLLARLLDPTDRFSLQKAMMDGNRLRELAAFNEQKRYRPPMQSRSGGMSLCLWKVCPAAPWLVTKREIPL